MQYFFYKKYAWKILEFNRMHENNTFHIFEIFCSNNSSKYIYIYILCQFVFFFYYLFFMGWVVSHSGLGYQSSRARSPYIFRLGFQSSRARSPYIFRLGFQSSRAGSLPSYVFGMGSKTRPIFFSDRAGHLGRTFHMFTCSERCSERWE